MLIADRQSLLSDEISDCETRPQLLQAMDKVAQEFGFTYVSILAAPGPNDTQLAPLAYESTIPPQFVRDFDRNHYLRDCPLLPLINDSILPRVWHLDDPDFGVLYDCPAPMSELMRSFGLVMGAIFTVNSVDTNRFFIRFDGDRPPLDQMELNELGMIAIHAFDIFDRMRRAKIATPNVLSARELEVLRWTAQGKTSIEIGQILSLSDHTINAYMNNAIKKLDCVNRTQLVAKAIRLKLIN